MKAILKNNFKAINKGDVFSVKGLTPKTKRIGLIIGSKIIDFDFRDVEIIANTDFEKWEIGHFFIINSENYVLSLTQEDIHNFAIQFSNYPIDTELLVSCLNFYFYKLLNK